MDEELIGIDDLDMLIEEALSGEPFLKAPLSLQRGVEARLNIAGLCEHEQRRFSISMASLALVFVSALTVSGVVLWFTNLSFLYSEGVSGGKGWLDYYMTALALSFDSYQGSYTLAVSLLLTLGALAIATVHQVHKLIYSE